MKRMVRGVLEPVVDLRLERSVHLLFPFFFFLIARAKEWKAYFAGASQKKVYHKETCCDRQSHPRRSRPRTGVIALLEEPVGGCPPGIVFLLPGTSQRGVHAAEEAAGGHLNSCSGC